MATIRRMTDQEREEYIKKFITINMKGIVLTVNSCLRLLGKGEYVYFPAGEKPTSVCEKQH